jgi:hypothetical protein
VIAKVLDAREETPRIDDDLRIIVNVLFVVVYVITFWVLRRVLFSLSKCNKASLCSRSFSRKVFVVFVSDSALYQTNLINIYSFSKKMIKRNTFYDMVKIYLRD